MSWLVQINPTKPHFLDFRIKISRQPSVHNSCNHFKLELPEEHSRVHDTFHVSNLKKWLSDESLVIPLKEIRLDEKLVFTEEPVEIMDREIKQLKHNRTPIVKVRWNSKRGPEYTWEREDQIRAQYPHIFP